MHMLGCDKLYKITELIAKNKHKQYYKVTFYSKIGIKLLTYFHYMP